MTFSNQRFDGKNIKQFFFRGLVSLWRAMTKVQEINLGAVLPVVFISLCKISLQTISSFINWNNLVEKVSIFQRSVSV